MDRGDSSWGWDDGGCLIDGATVVQRGLWEIRGVLDRRSERTDPWIRDINPAGSPRLPRLNYPLTLLFPHRHFFPINGLRRGLRGIGIPQRSQMLIPHRAGLPVIQLFEPGCRLPILDINIIIRTLLSETSVLR